MQEISDLYEFPSSANRLILLARYVPFVTSMPFQNELASSSECTMIIVAGFDVMLIPAT